MQYNQGAKVDWKVQLYKDASAKHQISLVIPNLLTFGRTKAAALKVVYPVGCLLTDPIVTYNNASITKDGLRDLLNGNIVSLDLQRLNNQIRVDFRSNVAFNLLFEVTQSDAVSRNQRSRARIVRADFTTELGASSVKLAFVLPELSLARRLLGRLLNLSGGYTIIPVGDQSRISVSENVVTYATSGELSPGFGFAFVEPNFPYAFWVLNILLGILTALISNFIWLLATGWH